MELVDVIATAHFSDTRIGALSRKQRTSVPKHVAEELVKLGVVQYVNPPATVAQEPAQTAPAVDGEEPLSVSSPVDQVSTRKTRKQSRRDKENADGELSQ